MSHEPKLPRRARDEGFTLLELLVVLGILTLLVAIASPQVLRYLGTAKTETARAQISAIATALELYHLDNGDFPTQLATLVERPPSAQRWNGPYLKKSQGLVDPWGRPYIYRKPGQKTAFELFTLGRDNAPGGTGEDQDISN